MITSTKLDIIKTIVNTCRGMETHEIEALRSALWDMVYIRQQQSKKQIEQMLSEAQ